MCFERHLVDKLLHRFPFQANVLVHGGGIGFYQGDIRLLMDDLQTLKPTVFPVVPRLLNRICDKVRLQRTPALASIYHRNCCCRPCLKSLQIFLQADTPLKKWLLHLAFSRKISDLNRGVVRRDTIWDRLIFRKVQVNIDTWKIHSLAILVRQCTGQFKVIDVVLS